jgi:membrane protein implicated in regulation of membrane protease activity
MMYVKLSVPTIGAAVIAGIGIEQLGGVALAFAIVALAIIIVAVFVVWIRVGQLSKQTKQLSGGVADLGTKIEALEETMNTSSIVGE